MADPLTCNLLAQSSSVLVEEEGEKVSSRPHPSPSSLHLSPWSFVPQLPLRLSLPIGHPNRFLCFRFPLLLGNNSQKEDREREGGEEELALDRHSITGNGSGHPSLLPLSTSRLGEGGKRTRRLLRRRRNLQNANLVKRTHSFLPSRLTHSATSSPLPLLPLLPFPDADKSRWR